MSGSSDNLCVLVANIVGSSGLHERLGDAEAHQAVERCLNRMERAAVACKGRVVKVLGDELMVAFDSAEAARHAADEMRRRIHALPPVSGMVLAIRVGFHHQGPVLDQNGDLSGDMVKPVARLAPSAETRLWLRHASQDVILGPDRPAATLGRDVNADIVIHDSRASRNHGRIEYRRDKYVLVDQSTNGTYVRFAGETEFVLKHEEAILRGRGHIRFGHAAEGDGGETLEFEVLG